MTTKATAFTQEASTPERFPEFPPRDDMQNTNPSSSPLGIDFSSNTFRPSS